MRHHVLILIDLAVMRSFANISHLRVDVSIAEFIGTNMRSNFFWDWRSRYDLVIGAHLR
jgi:hypothetical protein